MFPAFILYMVLLGPNDPPVVTEVGQYPDARICQLAAQDALPIPRNGIQPSLNFVCVRKAQ